MTNIGIIGFGQWPQQAYVPLLAEMPQVQVVAVSARSHATRQLAQQTFGAGVKTFDDYHDLLSNQTLDAVLIALPNSLHGAALQAAARSKNHLFFEPPVAETPATAVRVLDTLATSGCVVQADLELRYLPVMDSILQCIRSGRLGEPLMAKIRLWCNWGYAGGSWYDKVQGQSFFLWLGCWYLDVLDCIFEAEAIQASVVGGHHSNGTLMDGGWASLVYAGGGIGQFEFNLVVPQGTAIELTVACREGELAADLETGKWRWRGEAGDWQLEHTPASMPAHGFVGMRESLHGFFDTIHTGGTPRANIDVMRRVQRAAELCVDAEQG
ncbi:MAG: Gfo/Idh/MocA family oxidoreductase [Candidatus Poribacteria bacterium]|nr:Gfo/Idh/MocA family oxidoreductase [Candidatus Poribacteria bacterium]